MVSSRAKRLYYFRILRLYKDELYIDGGSNYEEYYNSLVQFIFWFHCIMYTWNSKNFFGDAMYSSKCHEYRSIKPLCQLYVS